MEKRPESQKPGKVTNDSIEWLKKSLEKPSMTTIQPSTEPKPKK